LSVRSKDESKLFFETELLNSCFGEKKSIVQAYCRFAVFDFGSASQTGNFITLVLRFQDKIFCWLFFATVENSISTVF
jgi:hypothetical protein